MNGEWRAIQHDKKRPMATGAAATSSIGVISASSSRMFTNYEISDEINRKAIQVKPDFGCCLCVQIILVS